MENCDLEDINNSQLINNPTLEKLNLNTDLCDNPTIMVLGKRATGKTSLIIDLIKHFKSSTNINKVIIICPTDKTQSKYLEVSDCIHHSFNDTIIEEILNERMNDKDKLKEQILIVLDDCLYSKEGFETKVMREIIYNSRHLNISFILSMQFPLQINVTLRINFDYVFLFKDTNKSTQKLIHDHYCGMFSEFETFKETLLQNTMDYNSMVIINRAVKSNGNKVKYYKANMSTVTDDIHDINEHL